MTDIDITNTEVAASLRRMRERPVGTSLHPDLDEPDTDTRDATPEDETMIDEIMRLRTALTASLAREAAAFEAAGEALGDIAYNWDCGHDVWSCNCSLFTEQWELAADECRALTPADAQAALDWMIADARAEGMREAARIASTSIFYPEDRTGYVSNEALALAVEKTAQASVEIYPGAGGDVVTALAYSVMQHASTISGAKSRWDELPAAILAKIGGAL